MKEIYLGDYIELLTDYHSGGSYKTLKENTKILYEKNYSIMIRTLNFESNDFENNFIYVDKKSYDFLNYCVVKENDVLVNKIANPGSVYIMPKIDYPVVCGMNLFLLRFKDINQRYMYYVMKNAEEYIKSQAHGTTTKTITKDEMKKLKFLIHEDKDEQERVAEFLTKIDKRKSINEKILHALEDYINTLYNYWFLQFEFPNANGKPYKSSGGKMVYNEILKLEIPETWEVSTLEDKISFDRGVSYTSDDINAGEGIPMINLASINRSHLYNPNEIKYYSGKNKKDLESNDLLIACTDLTRNAEIIGFPIIVPDIYKKVTFSMDLAKINILSDKLNKFYLYKSLRTDFYHNYIKGYATGTNVIHLNLDGVKWYNVVLPPIEIQNKFATIVEKVEKMKSKLMKDKKDMDELYNYVMPLIMNGQIKIEE